MNFYLYFAFFLFFLSCKQPLCADSAKEKYAPPIDLIKKKKYYPFFAGLDEETKTKIVYAASLKFLEEFSNISGKINSIAIYSVRASTFDYKNNEISYEEKTYDNHEKFNINKKVDLRIKNDILFSFFLKLRLEKAGVDYKIPTGKIVINKKICSLCVDGKLMVPHNKNHITLLSIMKYKGKDAIPFEASRVYKTVSNLNLFNLMIIPEGLELSFEENNEYIVIFF